MKKHMKSLMAYFRMNIILGLLGVSFLSACGHTPESSRHSQDLQTTSTHHSTIYLVRHSEKELDGGSDPALTEQGKYRAAKWAEVLRHVKLAAVYSTDTQRTRDTASPTANTKGLPVLIYDGRAPDIELFSNAHAGQSILIVGHSNTVPDLVNKLTLKDQFEDLSEKDYDDLFIVDITPNSRNAKRLTIRHILPTAD